MKLHLVLALTLIGGCEAAGPLTATVTNVVDGDTVDIDTGERVRYLMVDATELSTDDCWSQEARDFNVELVLGQQVTLELDVERTDRFGRMLAYVSVGDREVNSLLVERGYACVLHIPPNGDDRVGEFQNLEATAKAAGRGMWGECAEVTCD